MDEHVINLLAPFASGAVGVGVSLGVAWGILKTKVNELERRVEKSENILSHQVGQERCDKMRDECRFQWRDEFQKLLQQVTSNRDYVSARFEEIARYLGRMNGHDKL